jgi:hypothetical protein
VRALVLHALILAIAIGLWFATYQGGLNAELFVDMLELLMRHRRRPLFLVLDNLASHKARPQLPSGGA